MLLLQGVFLGFAVAAPLGPNGVLCIQRTLTYGRLGGLLSGLGSATAHGVYSCIAALGLAFVSDLLVTQITWFHVVGGLFLCYLGLITFRSKPSTRVISAEIAPLKRKKEIIRIYISTLTLALLNPMTIVSFTLMFASFVPADLNYEQATMLVGGVLLGSTLWWLILSNTISILHRWLTQRRLKFLNRFFGVQILGFGIAALVS
ncbi:MAG: LysE family transporter [Cyanobacteria bacterium P01_B01_bin.77]